MSYVNVMSQKILSLEKNQQLNPRMYLCGHQSNLDISGSPPILNVNWVICGRGMVRSWDLH